MHTVCKPSAGHQRHHLSSFRRFAGPKQGRNNFLSYIVLDLYNFMSTSKVKQRLFCEAIYRGCLSLETSLITKTFLILGSQLSLVFGICLLVIKKSRLAASEKRQFLGVSFTEGVNEKGELDLQPIEEGSGLKHLTTICIIAMILMVVSSSFSLLWGLITMTITSVTLGPVLGMMMLNMDENDGLRALKATLMITLAAAVLGLYSGLDFSGMGVYLGTALLILIIVRLVMLFTSFANEFRRVIASTGALLFCLFLLFDFSRLARLDENGVNDWGTALQIAVSLYLDIINLLLELLEAMES